MHRFELVKRVNVGGEDPPDELWVDVYRDTVHGTLHGVHVVGDDQVGHQVRSVMPWDRPRDGGTWTHNWSNADGGAEAILYVSSGRSARHFERTLQQMRDKALTL